MSKSPIYNVLSGRQAEKDLKFIQKTDIKLYNAICEEIVSLRAEPRPFGSRKLSGGTNYFRIRVGNYRIVYEIDEQEKTVLLYRVRHRKDIYKNL